MRWETRAEECLHFLLWCADSIGYPRPSRAFETFEGWAYGRGLGRQLRQLERRRFVERAEPGSTGPVFRFTTRGRRWALGGLDPRSRWQRPWDGRWRMVVFDVPRRERALRARLLNWLRREGFGCLQGSVWVTPDFVPAGNPTVGVRRGDARALVAFEAAPGKAEWNLEVAAGAWDFPAINAGYARYLTVLDEEPPLTAEGGELSASVRRWLCLEAATWREALASDPLLPESLHPRGYLGMQAWQRRQERMPSFFARLRAEFRPA